MELNGNVKNGFYKNGVVNSVHKTEVLNGFNTISLNGTVKNGILQTLGSKKKVKTKGKDSFEPVPLVTAIMTYLGFYILMFLGYINQLFFVPKVACEKNRPGFVPLYDSFESFYSCYVYRRVRDCWNRPISSCPGAEVVLKERVTRDYGWTFEFTGQEIKCLNLGSYNYLGFAEPTGRCADDAVQAIHSYGISPASQRISFGTNKLLVDLERLTARYLGVEDAIVFGMGFATNALNLPCFLGPGSLVLSDEKNHASLILGLRLANVTIKVFKHNNMKHLEKLLRSCISEQKYKKVLIVVEGVYSMEGSIVNLPGILQLKKKYKAYLYLDEAHSVGALGCRGRGVVDYYGCNPKDVDILMGTFTKSFGSAGGYIAGTKKMVDFIRVQSHAHCYANAMSAPVAQQILTSMKIIMGLDNTNEGIKRIKQLRRNTKYFRRRLHQMGVIIYGNEDSPVVPLLVYMLSKIGAVVRTLSKKHIAVVGVGFPATPLMEGRIRFCLSAAHTKQQLDYALETIDEISTKLGFKYSQRVRTKQLIRYNDSESEDDFESLN